MWQYILRVFVLLICTSWIRAAPPSQDAFALKVSPYLQSLFQSGEQTDIFIKMVHGTTSVLTKVAQSSYVDRTQRLNALHDGLLKNAEESQRNILEYLRKHQADFKSFWINNQIVVKNADLNLVQGLVEFPEILSIYEEVVVQIVTPEQPKKVIPRSELAWGLIKIQVPEAWEELKRNGNRHQIVVGTMDTGVRRTHEALQNNFFGEYGWYDAVRNSTTPEDTVGHGTHTLGTIVGSNGIGVAPDAKWMSCRACPTFSCHLEALFTCGEFLLCPTLPDGSSQDCSKAPHLVSNSWSGGQGSPFYNEVIDAWAAAGIITVFSIGNFGNAFCGSANSPGDQPNVIGVGSLTVNDHVSWFASIGPTKDGRLKPDLVAPGDDVVSAYYDADDSYCLMSGTSMSCPHVSGVIALLLSHNPNLTYDQVKLLVLEHTDQQLGSTSQVCEGIPDTKFPNHRYGYGRVNAFKSVRALTQG